MPINTAESSSSFVMPVDWNHFYNLQFIDTSQQPQNEQSDQQRPLNQSTGDQSLFEQPKLRRASEIADENLESLRNFSKINHTILSRASKKKIRRQEQHQRLTSAQNLHKRYKSFEPKPLNQTFERALFYTFLSIKV